MVLTPSGSALTAARRDLRPASLLDGGQSLPRLSSEMAALYRRCSSFCRAAPPAHTCRLPQRRPSAGVSQQSCAMAASEIKLSSPAPMRKRSPLELCQEGEDGEREQTLWSGFWALNGATQNNITCGRFRLLSFSCPSPQAYFLIRFASLYSYPWI